MSDCVCECLCANILALVFSCLPRSSHGKWRPHNASRDRLNYCSTSALQQIYIRDLLVSIASAYDILIMPLESILFIFSSRLLPFVRVYLHSLSFSVIDLKDDDLPTWLSFYPEVDTMVALWRIVAIGTVGESCKYKQMMAKSTTNLH